MDLSCAESATAVPTKPAAASLDAAAAAAVAAAATKAKAAAASVAPASPALGPRRPLVRSPTQLQEDADTAAKAAVAAAADSAECSAALIRSGLYEQLEPVIHDAVTSLLLSPKPLALLNTKVRVPAYEICRHQGDHRGFFKRSPSRHGAWFQAFGQQTGSSASSGWKGKGRYSSICTAAVVYTLL